VHWALLGVANALAAVGVAQMGRGHVAGADGRKALERLPEPDDLTIRASRGGYQTGP
jgi:hypothetical protein